VLQVKLVVVEVDVDAPENLNPIQAPDDTESIILRHVPVKILTSELSRLEAETGAMPIEGLYLFAIGLQMGLAIQ